MTALTTTGKNLLLDELKTNSGYIAIYTAVGEEDVQPITWDTVAAGVLTMAAPVTFDVSAGITVTKVILYDDAVGTNQYLEADLPNNESYTGDGLYTMDSWSITL